MKDPNQIEKEANAEMHTRRIDMGDGRYLIFFTFGDEAEGRTGETAEPNDV